MLFWGVVQSRISRIGGGGWWIIFEPISNTVVWVGILWYGWVWVLYCANTLVWVGWVGMVLCNLASYYVFIPCPLTIIMRPTATYTARHSAIIMRFRCDKIWNSAEGGRPPRDRAYWRGELSLHCSQLPLTSPFVASFSSPFPLFQWSRWISWTSVCTCTLGWLESVRLPFQLLPKLSKFEFAASAFWHSSSVICILYFLSFVCLDFFNFVWIVIYKMFLFPQVFPFWGLSEIGGYQAHCRRKMKMFWNVWCKGRFLQD